MTHGRVQAQYMRPFRLCPRRVGAASPPTQFPTPQGSPRCETDISHARRACHRQRVQAEAIRLGSLSDPCSAVLSSALHLCAVHDVEVVLLVLLREDLVSEGEVRREEGLGDLGLQGGPRAGGRERAGRAGRNTSGRQQESTSEGRPEKQQIWRAARPV